jgi:hypothetical protein
MQMLRECLASGRFGPDQIPAQGQKHTILRRVGTSASSPEQPLIGCSAVLGL